MKIDFLHEPKLEFGVSSHIDIRFGIMNYGPLDYASPVAPKEIRIGIVGTNNTVEGVQLWLERCKNEIPAKKSKQPNLFPKFPGFRPDIGFQSTLLLDSHLVRTISSNLIKGLCDEADVNQAILKTVEIFSTELCYLAENRKVDVLICALPQELLEITLTAFEPEKTADLAETPNAKLARTIDFHDLLKAKNLHLNIPIQIITPPTYGKKILRKKKHSSSSIKKLQDEATRAWNFHTALYYKAKGIPWRLLRDPTQFTTCYVGVSFYKSLDNSALHTSVAQIFNERGEGVIVRGGPARVSKEDRQPHLRKEDANELLFNALSRYREEHKSFPARIVVHKSSTYDNAEIRGFREAAQDLHVELLDLISISRSSTRLFRIGAFPPLRGTFLSLDEETHILYTRGSVDFFSTYPGIYVPRPLLFRCEHTEQTPRFLAQEILALTKMNWNTTQFDGSEPMTLHTSEQVKAVLKYVDQDERSIASSYRFYM